MVSQYRYRAKDWDGNRVCGTIPAVNKFEALDLLRARDLVPTDLKEQRYPGLFSIFSTLNTSQSSIFGRYSSRDMMILCRQLSTLLRAGVPVLQALNILSTQFEKQIFRVKLQSASFALEQGSSLAEALKQQSFPPLLINMIEAGETGGILDIIMERMAAHYENQHDLEEKIRSATAYPVFIIAVACAVVLVMIIFVLPQFASIFNSIGLEMPLPSRMLLDLGRFTAGYWHLILPVLLLTACGLTWHSGTEKGRHKVDRIRLRLPLYGKLYRQTVAARFARTLGTLIASGVTLYNALELADKTIDNRVISGSISKLTDALSRGESLAATVQSSLHFPPLLAEMIRVGEETGALDQTLNSAAAFYEKEVAYAVERLSTILEPLLLLAVGLFIGLLVFSILSPMYRVFEMI